MFHFAIQVLALRQVLLLVSANERETERDGKRERETETETDRKDPKKLVRIGLLFRGWAYQANETDCGH